MVPPVVITGIGMITPLGKDPHEVLHRVEAGECAAAQPTGFDVSPFACPVCAQVKDFRPQDYVAEPKMVRLMNRDAQMAVAAAHLALQDARLTVGVDYQPDEIALFGATGLAGLPLGEVSGLIRNSVAADGRFDLQRFGQRGLRSISPLLSFKLLGNMPVCFVSICEGIRGPNSIYTPWEGQGAQAIEAGVRAIRNGDARCGLVGGCDVKTHELAFMVLEQLGLFRSWRESGIGVVPGEGGVFLVLEERRTAAARGAPVYAAVAGLCLETGKGDASLAGTRAEVMRKALKSGQYGSWKGTLPAAKTCGHGEGRIEPGACVAGSDSDRLAGEEKTQILSELGVTAGAVVYPKQHTGNLFAAAAPLQVGLAALLARRLGRPVLANCFGHGSEQAAFLLEGP